MNPVLKAEAVCAAMLAAAVWNLWRAFAKGRILANLGMATRDDPFRFWSAVVFWGFAATLFGVLLLAFLDPRHFRPVLRIASCRQSVSTCIQSELKAVP